MSMEDEARTLALIALHQSALARASRLRINRETLQAVWPVTRWHEQRIRMLEHALQAYFPRVQREHYVGRVGGLAFDGFTVSGLTTARRSGKRVQSPELKLLVPTKHGFHFGDFSLSDDVPELRWNRTNGTQLLEYNLLLIRSNDRLMLK